MQRSVPVSLVCARLKAWLLDEIPPQHLQAPFLVRCSDVQARISLAVASALLQARLKNETACILVPTRAMATQVLEYCQEMFPEVPVHSPYTDESVEEVQAKVWLFTPEKFLNKVLGKHIRPIHLVFLDMEGLLDGRWHILEAVLVRVRSTSHWTYSWVSEYVYEVPTPKALGYEPPFTFLLSRLGTELPDRSPEVLETIGFALLAGLWKRHLTRRGVVELLGYLTFTGSNPEDTELEQEASKAVENFLKKVLPGLMEATSEPLLRKTKGRYTLTEVGQQVVKYGVPPSIHTRIVELITKRGMKNGKLLIKLYQLLSGGQLPRDTLEQFFTYKQFKEVEDVIDVLQGLDRVQWRSVTYTTNQITHIYSKILPFSTRDLFDQFSQSVKVIKEQKGDGTHGGGKKKSTWRLYDQEGLIGKISWYLKEVKRPITVKEVGEMAQVGRSVARAALEEMVRRLTYLLEKRVLTDIRSKRALYGWDFPVHLEQACGGCHFHVVPGRCSFWQTVAQINPLEVPERYHGREYRRLRPGTFACEAYRARQKKQVVSWSAFTAQYRRIVGWEGGVEQVRFYCPICTMELSQPSTTAQACPLCRTIIKLTRRKAEDQVEITPDRQYELQGLVHEVTGMLPDELPSGSRKAGILLFDTDEPRIEGTRLCVDLRGGPPWSERLERIGYVVTRRQLPTHVEAELTKRKIQLIHKRDETQEKNRSQAAPDIKRAVAFAQATNALTQVLTVSNILSRLNLLVALCHECGRDVWDVWHVIDRYVEARSVHTPETLRQLEGRAGVFMWATVKQILRAASLPLQSRTAERWVRETLLKPGIRGAAYSAGGALINFMFTNCYETLRGINGGTGLGYVGTHGVLHYRRTKSAVDTIGLLLDLAEPFKLAYLHQLLRDIRTKQIRPWDAAVLYGRARKAIFYVSPGAISRLHETCQRAETLEVDYMGQRGTLLTAYRRFAQHMEQFLRDLLMYGLTHTVPYQGQYLSYLKVGMEVERIEAETPSLVNAIREDVFTFTMKKFTPFVYTPRSKGISPILTQVGGLQRWF